MADDQTEALVAEGAVAFGGVLIAAVPATKLVEMAGLGEVPVEDGPPLISLVAGRMATAGEDAAIGLLDGARS